MLHLSLPRIILVLFYPLPCFPFFFLPHHPDHLALGLTGCILRTFVLNISSGWNTTNLPKYLCGFVPHFLNQISFLNEIDWVPFLNKHSCPQHVWCPQPLSMCPNFTLYYHLLRYIYFTFCIMFTVYCLQPSATPK